MRVYLSAHMFALRYFFTKAKIVDYVNRRGILITLCKNTAKDIHTEPGKNTGKPRLSQVWKCGIKKFFFN